MVIDTSALFAIAFGEPEANPFSLAIDRAPRRLVSAATRVEAASVFAGRLGTDRARVLLDELVSDLQIDIRPVDRQQSELAADALLNFGKGRHPAKLNLGDSFAYALSKATGQPLLFKGNDFSQTDVAAVEWRS